MPAIDPRFPLRSKQQTEKVEREGASGRCKTARLAALPLPSREKKN
jgi:hypothetical protein